MQPDDVTPDKHSVSENQAAAPPPTGESASQPWAPQVITPSAGGQAQSSAQPETPNQAADLSPAFDAPEPSAPVSSMSSSGFDSTSTPGSQPPASFTPPTMPTSSLLPTGPAAATPTPKRKMGKRKWLAAIIVLIIILAGGYAFAFYLPNTPGNIYKTGLTRTGDGYDKLVSYISTEQAKQYKGFSASGTFKLTSADGSGDGTFTAQSEGANSTGQLSLDLSGEKFSANYRSVEPKGQDEPDIYFQLNGIKPILDNFGLNSLDNLDGQWIAIDHTLLDTAVASQTGGKSSGKVTSPTYAQVQDALQKASPVNKKYLFTTNKKDAVLVEQKFLGTSKQDGRTVDGYQVGYNKANLKAYVNALGTALDGSNLNAWVKQTTGKTITDQLNITDLQKSIDKADSNYTFTIYVDTHTKLIHKVHFPDSSNPATNFVEAGLNYTGGDSYPFVLTGQNKENGSTTNIKLEITLNTSTNQIDLNTLFSEKGDTTTTLSESATFKPSNQSVDVSAPANAEPILNVLQSLGLGDLLSGGSAPSSTASSTFSPFTLTE